MCVFPVFVTTTGRAFQLFAVTVYDTTWEGIICSPVRRFLSNRLSYCIICTVFVARFYRSIQDGASMASKSLLYVFVPVSAPKSEGSARCCVRGHEYGGIDGEIQTILAGGGIAELVL